MPEAPGVAGTACAANGAADEQPPAFDVERAVAAFLADPSRSSLELPSSLTSAQRRHAKKVVDAHPELKSESYGFGAERCLHLFKTSDAGAGCAVSVKNTFIDDWIEAEDGAHAALEPAICRSMPVRLPERAVQPGADDGVTAGPCGTAIDLSPVVENSLRADAEPSPLVSAGSAGARAALAPASASAASAVPPTEIEVRNTFIHFLDETAADERCVQSMPDEALFRRQLMEEAAARGGEVPEWVLSGNAFSGNSTASGAVASNAPPVARAEQAPCDQQTLANGVAVEVHGLIKAPAFNGLSGVVLSFDAETGRYSLLLKMPDGGQQWAKIKRENLRVTALS
eukprot:TRINITY_DN4765_c0_g2_i1.p1 TRINITY_DN4765_c0_g2~~TRINITY_DN4765_c0_g2_i1.p1  ORF type:complete len:342 (-),score=88.14 TRINITY_DN4765_c0_g2_i1:77-1102(-)